MTNDLTAILTDLKALAERDKVGIYLDKDELTALIAKHSPAPVRKKRDGFREPKVYTDIRYCINGNGSVAANTGYLSRNTLNSAPQYVKTGNCFEHKHNAELVAEQQKLMASFVAWIDEHGVNATDMQDYVTPYCRDGNIQALCTFYNTAEPLKIRGLDNCENFICSNEADLKRYFANEETLRRTLYE